MNLLAPISQEKDMVSKEYVDKLIADLDLSGYAKISDLGALASKDSLAFSELTSKPTDLAGYGITDALGKYETAASATKLEDTSDFNIWGQTFFTGGKPKNVTGLATFDNGIVIGAGKAITFLDSTGASHALTYDSSKQAFKIDGDFYATGENSAGGMGSEMVDIEDLASRVTALETSGGMSNVNIKVTTLSLYNQQSITSTAMSSIAGLTVGIANNMLNGLYNKVIDNSGTYPKIWNYTATKASTSTMTICFSYGDGINTKESCRLDYSSSTGKWSIEIDEL